MNKLRDVVIFLAGAAFLHTVSHFLLPYYVQLPLNVGFMNLTPARNIWIIAISAVVTVVLLWIASKLKQ